MCVLRRLHTTCRVGKLCGADTAWALVYCGWLYVVEERGSGPDVRVSGATSFTTGVAMPAYARDR